MLYHKRWHIPWILKPKITTSACLHYWIHKPMTLCWYNYNSRRDTCASVAVHAYRNHVIGASAHTSPRNCCKRTWQETKGLNPIWMYPVTSCVQHNITIATCLDNLLLWHDVTEFYIFIYLASLPLISEHTEPLERVSSLLLTPGYIGGYQIGYWVTGA